MNGTLDSSSYCCTRWYFNAASLYSDYTIIILDIDFIGTTYTYLSLWRYTRIIWKIYFKMLLFVIHVFVRESIDSKNELIFMTINIGDNWYVIVPYKLLCFLLKNRVIGISVDITCFIRKCDYKHVIFKKLFHNMLFLIFFVAAVYLNTLQDNTKAVLMLIIFLEYIMLCGKTLYHLLYYLIIKLSFF